MITNSDQLQPQIWAKLQQVYDKYVDKAGEQIINSKIQQIVYEVLGQQTQQQIDYVIKNMFRLDTDQNGYVSFLEFANFLFRRHCGQMSLQKMHLKGSMSHGAQRKMTNSQFHTLLNQAYKFLGVKCSNQAMDPLFYQTDKDKDGLISYAQYFQIIQRYICKKQILEDSKELTLQQSQTVNNLPQIFSKLRYLVWTNLRALYQVYISGRNPKATDSQLRGLIKTIVGELSQTELTFILTQLFKLELVTIQFDFFARHFIYLVAQLGLSRFKQNHALTKSAISKYQFSLIFKNTFKFLRISKIKEEFLWLHFSKIDKNNDGLISFEEYLDWIKRFLSVLQYFGDQFYVSEDDEDSKYEINSTEELIKVLQTNRNGLMPFKFTDLSLAKTVRKTCYNLLEKYDFDKDRLFSEPQIQAALTDLLKEDKYELEYVTKNVFRYDRDGDQRVTYDQLTDFCVEQHFGQMAIQRLHKNNLYSKGRQRIMNQEQFAKTLTYALDFLGVKASEDMLKLLFKQIDLDNDGWISYQVYFMFLKYQFGSLSQAAKEIKQNQAPKLSKDQQYLLSLKNLSPLERFVRILLDQLKQSCLQYDFNKNLVFQIDQIQAILMNIFRLNQEQVSYIIYQYFRLSSRKQQFVTFQDMISVILEIYFIQIFFSRKSRSKGSQSWKYKLISLQQFVDLIIQACFFIRVKPPKEDLQSIFRGLDDNKDQFISFSQYIAFIRKYLGKGLQIIDEATEEQVRKPQIKESKVVGVSTQQIGFVGAVWDQLKRYFDRYDKGSKDFLNQEELKAFVVQVLRQTSKRQLQYIFWNMFRVDTNLNRQVDFSQFAPYILNHAAEISLQRFHKEQGKGKSHLTEEEFFIVLKNAYSFLSTMPQSRDIAVTIYKRISTGGTLTYAHFLNWILKAITKKYK